MANRLARNKNSPVQPPSHYHILLRSGCCQVSHVRSHPAAISMCFVLTLPFYMFVLAPEVYQTSSTHFHDNPRSVFQSTQHSSSLQAQTKSSTCSKSLVVTSRNGLRSGMLRPLRKAHSSRLSWTSSQKLVNSMSHHRLSSHSPINVSSPLLDQRHGLLLQTCVCPFARTHVAVGTARRARRDRHGPIQFNSVRF